MAVQQEWQEEKVLLPLLLQFLLPTCIRDLFSEPFAGARQHHQATLLSNAWASVSEKDARFSDEFL